MWKVWQQIYKMESVWETYEHEPLRIHAPSMFRDICSLNTLNNMQKGKSQGKFLRRMNSFYVVFINEITNKRFFSTETPPPTHTHTHKSWKKILEIYLSFGEWSICERRILIFWSFKLVFCSAWSNLNIEIGLHTITQTFRPG